MKKKEVIVPTITPLTPNFTLDDGAVEKMFNNFAAHDAVPFIIGTTGEAASLPVSLKKAFIEKAASLKPSVGKLYVGIASNCVEESIELGKHAFEKGADAVAANLPSYYALTNNEIKTYFETLADALKAPLIIYNIPATTHMSIPLPVIDELSHHPHIVGVKDSERSDERLNESLQRWAHREDFAHYIGWAAKSADALLGGSDGLIPSTGNVAPQIYQQMMKAFEAGDKQMMYDCQTASDAWGDLYQKGRSLGQSLWALKRLMQEASLCQQYVMPPLQAGSKEDEQHLLKTYADLQKRERINN